MKGILSARLNPEKKSDCGVESEEVRCWLGSRKRNLFESFLETKGASLVTQWLRVCLPMQGTTGSSPGLGRSHMPWSD